jgi:FkbM family methyltransferase
MLKEIQIEQIKSKLKLDFKGIIQIGSFDVREYNRLRNLGFQNYVFVDANPSVCKELEIRFSKENHKVINCAVSNKSDESVELLLLSHLQSSSILEPHLHVSIYPKLSEIVGAINIPSITIDDLVLRYAIDQSEFTFLMMDIQGAEGLAIAGAQKTLPNFDFVYSEINYLEMYKGCMLEIEFTKRLHDAGFEKVLEFDVGCGWGDAFYVKKKLISL